MKPQFKQIQVQAAQITAGSPLRIDFPFEADWFAFPAALTTSQGGQYVLNTQVAANMQLAIRINDEGADPIPFSGPAAQWTTDYCASFFVGKVKTIFITLIAGATPTNIALWVGKNCNIGFNGGVYGARPATN